MSVQITPKGNFFAANYREILAVILALLGIYYGRNLLQSADPTAAVSDFGMVDVLFFGMFCMLAGYLFLWVLLRLALKTIYGYLDTKAFRRDFMEYASPETRIWVTVAFILGNVYLLFSFTSLFAGGR